MPLFRFRAVDGGGKLIEGEREDESELALARRLRDEGFYPLKVDLAPLRRRAPGLQLPVLRTRRFGSDALALFTRQLATLLGAGLTIEEALATIAGEDDAAGAPQLARAVSGRLRAGDPLSAALEQSGLPVPKSYIALVRAGEAGGALPAVLEDLAGSLERSRALENDVRAALTYPKLILIATAGAVLLLLAAVIPEFEPILEDAGDTLPLVSRIVLAASQTVRAYWLEGTVLLLLLVLAGPRLLRGPALRAAVDRWAADLPIVGQIVRMAEAARFSRSLATLLANGVEVAPALELSAATLGNRYLSGRLRACVAPVRRGEGIAQSLAAGGALPSLAIQLIRAGEASSRLPQMLRTVAEILEADLRRSLQRLVALITPAVTIFLGVIVGGIVGAVLSAIMSSYNLPF